MGLIGGRVCLVVPWGVFLEVQFGVHQASVGGFHTGVATCDFLVLVM